MDDKRRDLKSENNAATERAVETNATSPEELSDNDLEQVSGGGDGGTNSTWRPS